MLEREIAAFDAMKAQLLKTNLGQYTLFQGDKFLGSYTTFEEALSAAAEQCGEKQYLIKQVLETEPKHHIPALMHGLINAHP